MGTLACYSHPLLMPIHRGRARVYSLRGAFMSVYFYSIERTPKKEGGSLLPKIDRPMKIQQKQIIQIGQQRHSNSGSFSVDPDQIQQFENVSDPNECLDKQHGLFRPLHAFNRIRIPWIRAYFANELSSEKPNGNALAGKRILDVGCGAGILSTALGRCGAKVVGLDASPSMIRIAQSYRGTLAPNIREKVEFTCGTVEEYAEIPENIGAFDGVVASEVVEHVSNLPLFIHNCVKFVRPNSPLFFTTINRTLWSYIFAKTLAEDVFRILPPGLHDYDKFVTPHELRKLLLDDYLRVGPVQGLCYNPLLNKWDWSSFSEVNYAMIACTGKES